MATTPIATAAITKRTEPRPARHLLLKTGAFMLVGAGLCVLGCLFVFYLGVHWLGGL